MGKYFKNNFYPQNFILLTTAENKYQAVDEIVNEAVLTVPEKFNGRRKSVSRGSAGGSCEANGGWKNDWTAVQSNPSPGNRLDLADYAVAGFHCGDCPGWFNSELFVGYLLLQFSGSSQGGGENQRSKRKCGYGRPCCSV